MIDRDYSSSTMKHVNRFMFYTGLVLIGIAIIWYILGLIGGLIF